MRRIIILALLFATLQINAQQSISDIRNLSEGTTVTLSGIVTNGSEVGSIRYVQDKTGGLAVYDTKMSTTNRGDSITVTGVISSYNNLFEIKNVTALTVHTSGNKLPDPKILTIDEIGEEYEGQLIRINDIRFEDAGATFSGNKNYNFTDETKTGVVRIGSGSVIVGQNIPTGKTDLISICSQYSHEDNDTRSGYQLIPRDINDFISNRPINITSRVIINNITETSFTLTWSTNNGASSEVFYGFNNDPSTWTGYARGGSNATGEFHYVKIENLPAGTIVYARVFSVLSSDTAFSSTSVYATASNSTGEMKVYFNTKVNTGLATGDYAENIGKAMEDTLIAYIDRAEKTIDFCIYNINNSGLSNVSEALNRAYNRGVRVRFITSGNTAHSGVEDLTDGINVVESPYSNETGIMHNKFVIFDADVTDATKPWVWTGSTNLTYDQVNSDSNNMIFIQDQSLARAYKLEFEEMWGSSDETSDSGKSKFGAAKTDNTPHEFNIGGSRVELYFSPSDGTNQKIIDAINSADNDLDVETMIITRSDIANAIKNAQTRGVAVQVITNREKDNADIVNSILSDALPSGKYIFDNNAYATLHHKVAIIDANLASSDPQVITGSHNWSNSANNRNDENTLIIHSAGVANEYFQQFGYRFAENGGDLTVSAESVKTGDISVYPNPVTGIINISSVKPVQKVSLFSLNGIKIKEADNIGSTPYKIDLSAIKPGVYILKVFSEDDYNTYKIVKK